MNEPTVPQSPALLSYFDRLRELFDRVLDLPDDEREAEVARLGAESPELADDLRALLEHAERNTTPLDDGALSLGGGGGLLLPRIPGFRVHRCIGRGGSATVFLADQEHAEFTRKVALKVVDRLFDTGSLRSAREEQRILARLEHPGIARLYDSGVTPWGQHWLAMEYVEGESILQHCNARSLSVRERIELFLPVLDAVAYAHARDIVHRDLKPANIFVTATGEARLLDFGIAKLSDPTDEDETRTLRRALTPAYASPEQMRGDRITSSSDIYSLGVVLYELLAGTLPGDDTEQRRAVGGDVDAVLNKALRQQPGERYTHVKAFADDLRNVLARTPVSARRGDRMYRARKILRRHRAAVTATIALLLIAVAGWQIVSRWRAARPGNEVAIYHDASSIDAQTRRWLRDGAARLERLDGMGARDNFRRAAESSKGTLPGEALAWDGVARAEESLGEIGRSAEASRRANALIERHGDVLPKYEAERLRARALAANHDWNAAIAALEALFSAQPERLDIGLDLIGTLLACGRTEAADTALGRLRQLATAGGDPRVDLMEAEVALQLSEFQRAAAAASRARDRATNVQAVVLGQRAARVHAEAIGRLDQREQARRELTAIVTRNTSLGLTRETAAAQVALGPILTRMASKEETRRTLEAALAGCIQAGDRRGEVLARAQLALVAGKQGKLPEAIRAVDAALVGARAIGDRWAEGYVLSQRLTLYSWAHDEVATKATIEPTLAALRDSGNRRLLMGMLTNAAIPTIEALDLERAEAYIVEAEELAHRVGSQVGSAYVDGARAQLERARGDLDLARKSYAAAIDKARRAGVSSVVADYQSELAWMELEDGRPAAAVDYAQSAIAQFNALGDTRSALKTEGVLVCSDAIRGDRAGAEQRLAKLRKAAEANPSGQVQFNLLAIDARVAEAAGDWRRAIELRRQTVRMASAWNAPGLRIDQQMYLAKALHGAGERGELEKLVGELLPECERHGFAGDRAGVAGAAVRRPRSAARVATRTTAARQVVGYVSTIVPQPGIV